VRKKSKDPGCGEYALQFINKNGPDLWLLSTTHSFAPWFPAATINTPYISITYSPSR